MQEQAWGWGVGQEEREGAEFVSWPENAISVSGECPVGHTTTRISNVCAARDTIVTPMPQLHVLVVGQPPTSISERFVAIHAITCYPPDVVVASTRTAFIKDRIASTSSVATETNSTVSDGTVPMPPSRWG
jgi:hypothetical protein